MTVAININSQPSPMIPNCGESNIPFRADNVTVDADSVGKTADDSH
jgi:hypothetical protein